MQGHAHVGLGKAGEQPIVDHPPRSLASLFGGLANEYDRARPVRFVAGQKLCHADQIGNVDVVAAGMHHAGRDAILVSHLDLRGIRQPGVLRDRQGVQIGPQHEASARGRS